MGQMQHYGIFSSTFSTLAAGGAANVSNVTFNIKTVVCCFYLQRTKTVSHPPENKTGESHFFNCFPFVYLSSFVSMETSNR